MKSEQSAADSGRKLFFSWPRLAASWSLVLALAPFCALADEPANRLFENQVRPIFLERCSRCHGAKKQSGGLRIDSREALTKGGESGPAIVPGDVQASLLVQAVRRDGDLEMPPDKPLSDREIRALEQWIKLGAAWPEANSTAGASTADRAQKHWAFQPVQPAEIPTVQDTTWWKTPIDAFVKSKLDQAGLSPSPAANRRVLIRRASYVLTGLPPTPDQVASFVNDPHPDAYAKLVDRLLDSPQYGEQWARHWLDVARYSDTKGYVYAREERFWVHAWVYRDWIVRALNEDLPYNRFLLLQLAADLVQDRSPRDLAAMGFLTVGRRFLGVKHDIIDDRIDVVCRGTLGLTVGCARCHDHKYDPIPSADYYSLYGVFDSCSERLVSLRDPSTDGGDFENELQRRQEKLRTKLAAFRAESSRRVRARVADYLRAQTELHKYPSDGFDQVFEKTDLLPSFVRRWESYMRGAQRRRDPVFAAWRAFAEIPSESFASQASAVARRLHESPPNVANPIVSRAFLEPPRSFDEVIDRYGAIFAKIEASWQALLSEAAEAKTKLPRELPESDAEQLRQVLYGLESPCVVPDEPVVHTETFFDTASCTELWKLQGEVDRWIINSNGESPHALTLVDRPVPVEPRIFRRGNPRQAGEQTPRRFLRILSLPDRKPFLQGSGRLELAEAIIDPQNPLTARVIVNRVWARHFGRGLVSTPSDFGARADPPSHPRLLDWLASRFVAEGWSLKKLHRWIMLSATFQQASTGPADPAQRTRALRIDPDNRLLWRMKEKRLTFEEFRDSLLAASGELDLQLGGKPANLFQEPFPKRRTIYGLVDRQFLPGTLRMFDFANPDLHVAQRNETTAPQQALFFLNHPLVLERARALAPRGDGRKTPSQAVAALFQSVFQREPTDVEIAESLELVRAAGRAETNSQRATSGDWQYGYGALDEAAQRVKEFKRLPHFNGAAWQGGSQWPDAKLGWVQLTASGGHPGNDRQRAAIRRWTAPRPMTVHIRTQLRHDAAPGDGIRAFVVSSRAGLLQSRKIHQQAAELNVDSLAVEQGETIDFVVDIGDVLNSDQYLWQATIERQAARGEVAWNSKLDFPRETVHQLTAWEQLAHVLLCANEFLFVD